MKKLLILFLMLPCISFADFNIYKYQKEYWYLNNYKQINNTKFIVKAKYPYYYKLKLDSKQYVFFLNSKDVYKMSIIEPSGYEYPKMFSTVEGEIVRFENIMDKGEYIIKIYSDKNIVVEFYYGTY